MQAVSRVALVVIVAVTHNNLKIEGDYYNETINECNNYTVICFYPGFCSSGC